MDEANLNKGKRRTASRGENSHRQTSREVREETQESSNAQILHDDCYTSLKQWELENFPNVIKERKFKELQKNPEALGTAIANNIFHEIGIELSKDS